MKKIYSVICTVVFAYSCNTDLSIDIPKPTPKICIAGFISPDSIMVSLSKSKYILDNKYSSADIIDTPSVINIYENEKFFCSLIPKMKSSKIFYTSDKKPIAGNDYRIEVSVKDLPSVTAKTSIPKTVPILKVDTINYLKDGYDYTLCTIFFDDPVETTNYYYFEAKTKDGSYYPKIERVDCDDPIVEEKVNFSRDQLLFSDKLINGQKYGLKVSVPTYLFYSRDEIQLCLYSISKDFYLHIKSSIYYDKAMDDRYSEPIQVYSNIDNGLGIFAGLSPSKYIYYRNINPYH